jgi:signal transduction histidine kinase
LEQVQDNLAKGRAHTDASLDAERAATDARTESVEAQARKTLDDLVESDRNLADYQLLKFRGRTDSLLARGRAALPARNSSVAAERNIADQDRKAEREATDALLSKERERADATVNAERLDQAALREELEARRQDTDEQLSTERSGTDRTLTSFGETKRALAHAHDAQSRGYDVLGMVTHDLRSPLSVIILNADSISEATQESATHRAALTISRAASRIERLLTDLLDAARIESGTLRIVKESQDIGVLLKDVLNSYGPLFHNRGMTFNVEVPVSPVSAVFDYDRIVQVLSNLLSNALKFTPHGGTVTLLLERSSDHVEFVLRDNGPGIHPSALPHIFERFWQVDNDTRRGLGLGLHICERIIAAHDGRIWVESEYGKGATFRFTLPLS